MAHQLTNKVETDREFLRIEGEAGHHAKHLNPMLRHLYNYVISKINFLRDTVQLYERNGNLARTTWITHRGRRLVFSYAYSKATVELRDGSVKGACLASFDGTESSGQISSKLASYIW